MALSAALVGPAVEDLLAGQLADDGGPAAAVAAGAAAGAGTGEERYDNHC